MKESPQQKKLEDILRYCPLVSGGFMGEDLRPVKEIIDTDTHTVEQLGYTNEQIAERMEYIRNEGLKGLGSVVKLNNGLEVRIDDNRGLLPSPWPDDPHRSSKTITFVLDTDTGNELRWSDLSIHLIRAHGFYQGHGSPFRLNPSELISVIFK
ncbi:MAG: hypothetical protein RBU23_07930 [Candidatus Auribacterota bacterium]|jgi:hypothetical protein|nr:hypothetical protein [Candidatus Auribacterota bacterium]